MTSAKNPKALVFDWDNTLVSSWDTIHDALNHMLVAMDHAPWSLGEVRERVRHSLRDAFPKLFGERWQEARQIYLDRFEAIHIERLNPLSGAEALLQSLHADGRYLGVVSNKTGRLLRREAEALGWDKYFGAIVGAGDAARDKPDPAPVGLALAPSGIGAGPGVWFVGDTGIDLACGLAAGCTPVLVHGGEIEHEFAQCRPAYSFADCRALTDFLRAPDDGAAPAGSCAEAPL